FVNLNKIIFIEKNINFPNKTIINSINNIEFAIPLNNKIINQKKILDKINKKINDNQKIIDFLKKNIKNPSFLSKAPKIIIKKNLQKLKKSKMLKIELLQKFYLIKYL
ncbi:hypothetical protein, partial [Enterobacteriaceae endosymbiont of Donacia piscatrix]|uniref:hypothetical protein n=1 Tax=Enterobacteriaceae endosymbiont of Donacia piscatrix TaxID=2675780 RepID=UPI001B3A88A4